LLDKRCTRSGLTRITLGSLLRQGSQTQTVSPPRLELEYQNLRLEHADGLQTEANFSEKALFVKPTWRPPCGERNYSLPFALCFYSHSRGAFFLVARCMG